VLALGFNTFYSFEKVVIIVTEDILEPSHLLSCQYSMLHNQQPKNDDPNIVCSIWEIPFAEAEMSDLSISLPKCLHSMKEDTQHVYGIFTHNTF